MARSDEILKGVGIGIGAALLVPIVISTLAPLVRPLARTVLKAGILAYEKGRETFEAIGESVEDIVAEVEEELLEAHEARKLTDSMERPSAGTKEQVKAD